MARVILLCGKICSGKTTYASYLCKKYSAVLLSVDEVMLSIFGQHCADKHDEYAARTQAYLYQKSVELIHAGMDVILDWGFWSYSGREYARAFYQSHHICCEFHYLDVDDQTLQQHIQARNQSVLSGAIQAYYVDPPLAQKCNTRFETPDCDEIPIRVSADLFDAKQDFG
ncbi:MAG: ATP-binding protein [Clostridia bacterium]|nr:ATP-binding protein [Clostridia bacterium]